MDEGREEGGKKGMQVSFEGYCVGCCREREVKESVSQSVDDG